MTGSWCAREGRQMGTERRRMGVGFYGGSVPLATICSVKVNKGNVSPCKGRAESPGSSVSLRIAEHPILESQPYSVWA